MKTQSLKIYIYAGLSLTPHEGHKQFPSAIFLPPIKRGDLAKLYSKKPDVIAIIDGQFDQNLAVAPDEIFDMIARGIRVYGSSSMGALRAAELHRIGMIGCGKICAWIKNDDKFQDDFVAQTFTRINGKIHLLNYTHADLHFYLLVLQQKKMISHRLAKQIEEASKKLYYTERTQHMLIQKLKPELSESNRIKIDSLFKMSRSKKTQKRIDAEILLKTIINDIYKISKDNIYLNNNLSMYG